METAYTSLLIVFIIAWFIPMVLSYSGFNKIPTVIMEIIAGVVIGPQVMGLVAENNEILRFLSQTGFLLLIFLSGLALDIDNIINSFPKGKLRRVDFVSNSFLLAFLLYLGSIVVSYLFLLLISAVHPLDIVFFTIILPSIALSIVVPLIKNDGEIKRKYGQVILLTGAIATIMSILLIAIYSGILQNGFQFELLLFFVIFVVFFVALKVGHILVKVRVFQQLMYKLEHAASQIRIRGAFAVLLLFIVVADLINTELVLGAFFAGALISIFLTKDRSALLFKLDGMSYGFFIPIFFIMVGVNLDLNSLKNINESIPFILLVTLGMYLVEIVPSFLLSVVFGIKKAVNAGILLASRLGLTIAIAQVGQHLELISTAENAGIVVASIITCLVSPLVYNLLGGNNEDKLYSIYIIGGQRLGKALAARLKLHGVSYLVIEKDPNIWFDLQSQDIETVNEDYFDISTYKALHLRPVDVLMPLTDDEEANVRILRLLKNELGHKKLLTVSEQSLFDENCEEHEGVTVINPENVVAAQIENELFRPTTLHTFTNNFSEYIVEEISLENHNINGKLVKDIPFHPAGSIVVLKRGPEVLIPHGDTRLQTGDKITVIGNADALEEFRKILR